jgi:AcrR family transcriptional regulator
MSAPERRAAILRASFPLFAVRGFEGTTTRDLASAAGVTEPILYRHFPSKADLFAAVLDGAAERILVRVGAAVAGTRGAGERLEALAQRLEPMLAELEDEFRVVNGAAATHADPATTAVVRDVYTRIGAALSKAFAGGGLRRGVRPETAGHLLLEVGLGASLVRPLGVAAVARVGYGQAALRLLLRALTRPANA